MTDVHVLRQGGVGNSRDEQARRAVQAFRSFQPTLTSYARALTGRPEVRVEMHSSSNGMTDGTIIYYRPPIELGDNTPHVRRLCNKREDLQLLCKACRMREKVLVVIYHEINHIVEGTFAETTEAAKAEAIKRAIEENGTKYAKQIENAVKNAPSHIKDSYLGLAGIISPFLPVLVNALEDARVNTRGFQKRKGTRIMFNADTQGIFAEGVEQKDPFTGEITKIMWKDYPLNSQVSVGVFCKASGYDYEDWFAPVVKQALDDPELTALVSQIEKAQGPEDTFEMSFPILARLRELGFCKSDKDPENEEENEPPEGDPDVSEDGEEQPDSESGSGGPSGDSDEDDESGSDDEADADGSESGDSGSEPDGQVAGSEDEAEEDSGDGGDDSAGAGSSDDSDADEGQEPASGDGSEGSASGDDGSSEREAEPGDSDAGESAHGDDSAGTPEGGSSEEQELGSSSTGTGSETVGGDSDDESSAEGQKGDQQTPTPTGEGSDENADRDSEAASDSDSEADDVSLDEDRGDSSPGRAEHDDGVEHSENSGDLDDVGDDREQDRSADDSLQSSTDEGAAEDGEPAPIDTGADEGLGGVQLVIPDDADMGDADQALEHLKKVEQHDERPTTAEMRKNDSAMEVAVIQGLYFETPSANIRGVRENRYGKPSSGSQQNSWELAERYVTKGDRLMRGIDGDFDPKEEILGPALLHMRVVFADNQRGRNSIHLKSGRVNAKVLGRRAPVHDPRLFKKRTQPGKKDYFVVIGVDISGSTVGENLVLTKKAVMAQATLLSRMGIKFAIYAHSGTLVAGGSRDFDLDIYMVKEPEEPWSEQVKDRLRKLGSYVVNLDGHALEYLRKVADRSNATDKIILYYSDGKMPAENHDEELRILQREIKMCTQKGYTLLGVGIRTDSPRRHGLDTVQVDEDSDLVKVVRHIEKRLLAQ